MSYSPEKGYFDSEGEKVDFNKKRFQFWLEMIPPDIRRLEHDLLRKQRELLHANLYRFDNKKRHGRFLMYPPFTDDLREKTWEDFENSFLKGDARRQRFSEIIGQARTDIPTLFEKHSIIPKDKSSLSFSEDLHSMVHESQASGYPTSISIF